MAIISANGFQAAVNILPPKGQPGDFAGANIRANVIGGPGAFVAPASGTIVGRGAWCDPVSGVASNYLRKGSVKGFIHRTNGGSAIITNFLAAASLVIPQGNEVIAMDQGEFWGLFPGGATAGQKVYFDAVTGSLTAAATGGSATVTITAGGASVTSGVLTTTDADVTGTIAVGELVTDSGGNLPPGTFISAANGTGTGTHLWILSNADAAVIPNVAAGSLTWALFGAAESQFFVASPVAPDAVFTATLAAPAAPATFGLLTVSVFTSGTPLAPGQYIYTNGTVQIGINSAVKIISQTGGTIGGAGTYLVLNGNFAFGSGQTCGATQGQLGKLSSWMSSWN